MKTDQKRFSLHRELTTLLGIFLYSVSMNMFITPAKLYASSILGICQIIRTLLEQWFLLDFGSVDFSGILYWAINVHLLALAWFKLDRWFVIRTLLSVSLMSLFLAILPTTALLPGDTFSACFLGGIIGGIGSALVLRGSATMGGGDLISMMILRKHPHFSIGKLTIIMNLFVYGACLLLFDIPTAIYSVAFIGVYSVALDQVHSQNIDVEVMVITKKDAAALEHTIFEELQRGVTQLQGVGAYTQDSVNVLLIALSEYEVSYLRNIIRRHDPEAFVIEKSHVKIFGNYQRRL